MVGPNHHEQSAVHVPIRRRPEDPTSPKSAPSSSAVVDSANSGIVVLQGSSRNVSTTKRNKNGGPMLKKYFLVGLFFFALVTFLVNSRVVGVVFTDDVSALEFHLGKSIVSISSKTLIEDDDEDLHVPSSNDEEEREDEEGNEQMTRQRSANLDKTQQRLPELQQRQRQRPPGNSTTHKYSRRPSKQQGGATAHRLAGLDCKPHGGPRNDLAEEMVYWQDIPQDSKFVSPFKSQTMTQYLTAEPDIGGWNNIRMAMETVLGLAHAMGRTLVLWPEQPMYLLWKNEKGTQRNKFGVDSFFHMESISNEHEGLDIITMQEFLEREAMTGNMLNRTTGKPTFPPNNRTDWNRANKEEMQPLKDWLRHAARTVLWKPGQCLAVFPKSNDPREVQKLREMKLSTEHNGGFPRPKTFIGKPVDVDGPTIDRMKENWVGRKELCIYNERMQSELVVHFPSDRFGEFQSRLLVHFYAFLFFQDWKDDLRMKRFVRDHVRYVDEIQCAAARVVAAVRRRAQSRNPQTNPDGLFDTFHIRRGDFQYKPVKIPADQIYAISTRQLQPGATVFIATDEKNMTFFQPLMDHYDVVFLHDFKDELVGINTNYYGMVDQLVASRGRKFFGCFFSTFTGYINRLRGYHTDYHQLPGYEQGIIPSWYYAKADRYGDMQTYYPVQQPFFGREFPTAWRLLDTGVVAEEEEAMQ